MSKYPKPNVSEFYAKAKKLMFSRFKKRKKKQVQLHWHLLDLNSSY